MTFFVVSRLPDTQQRVGGFFLNLMPQMKALNVGYCSNHPSAVSLLTQHRYVCTSTTCSYIRQCFLTVHKGEEEGFCVTCTGKQLLEQLVLEKENGSGCIAEICLYFTVVAVTTDRKCILFRQLLFSFLVTSS